MKHLGKLSAVVAGGAIAVTGLVATTGSAIAAAAPAVTYNCTFTGVDSSGQPVQKVLSVPLTATYPSVPLTSGTAIPAGTIPVSAKLDLTSVMSSPEVSSAIGNAVGTSGKLGGSVAFDGSNPVMIGSVPVTGSVTAAPAPLTSLLAGLTGTGTLGAFTPTGSGAETVLLPAKFILVPAAVDGSGNAVPLPSVPCTSATAQPVAAGTVNVVSFKVKAPKKVHAGKVANPFKVTVKGAKGKVVAKVGTKTVGSAKLNKIGKATVKVKGLKKGSQTIVFSVGSASTSVTVKVVK